MTLLQIFIPEHFDPAGQTACPWVLRESNGRMLRQGEAALAAMPKADRVRLVAPAARVLLSRVRIPLRSQQKMQKLLPYAVEDKLMYDPDSIHVAAGPRQGNDEVAVAVIERGWMESVVAALRQAGLRASEMWPEMLLGKYLPDEWQVVWRAPGGFARTGEWRGFALDDGTEDTPPLALRLALDEALLAGKAPRSVTVLPVNGVPAPDCAAWRDQLGVEVQAGNAWDWAAQASQGNGGINLLQGEFTSSGIGLDWLPHLKPALILCGMIALLELGGGLIDWGMLRYEENKLRAGMEADFRKAFPEAKVVVDAALQMRRNLADLRHAAGQPDGSDFLPMLAKAAPVLADHAKIETLQYEKGLLKFSLRLQSASVADLKSRLAMAGLLAEFDNASAVKNAVVNMTLTAGRGG